MGSRRKALLELSHCANILLSPTKRSIFPNFALSANALLASPFCSSTFSRSSADGTPVENDQPPQSNRDSTLLEKFRLRKLKGLSKISQHSSSSNGGEKVMTGFRQLGLCNELAGAVEEMGILAPSELDCAAIPAVLEGKNVVLGYLNGPERALAYLLPLIQGPPNASDQLKPTPTIDLEKYEKDNKAVRSHLLNHMIDAMLDLFLVEISAKLLHDYENTEDVECSFMGNSTTARALGKGKILLKLTSGKILSLSNVLYVPSLRRNLVSGSLLNRAGLKIVLEGDKVILTKNGDFVGKGYMSDGLFVLNTIMLNASTSSSAYVVESTDMWHHRLGHVNHH
ncbi:DEAD-box ATP-dependent RNA helicase 39-like [Cucumis melo var. makuwa]|uniref:DEAD-box ATP-dependent RNA helicase 39-like n=1 Tax=Cucumis melo var. makuwa TaxID=1194695 RepID=A0A5D3BZD4_CUCMM|nr:DEAD-box ATP-dependent RNA helicase 39-like [Cucumis melo var. makuwa]